jgi:hypothetical protein
MRRITKELRRLSGGFRLPERRRTFGCWVSIDYYLQTRELIGKTQREIWRWNTGSGCSPLVGQSLAEGSRGHDQPLAASRHSVTNPDRRAHRRIGNISRPESEEPRGLHVGSCRKPSSWKFAQMRRNLTAEITFLVA